MKKAVLKELRKALNSAVNPNNRRWNMDAMEFFRILRAEKVGKDQVVFGIRSPKVPASENLTTFDRMASKSNTIQMRDSGSDAE